MTITIDIHLHPEHGPVAAQLDEAMKALGYSRVVGSQMTYTPESALPLAAQEAKTYTETGASLNPIKVPEEPITQAEAEAIVQTAKVRERGKPSPGHARRTKAEIAEDDAADKADADRATQGVADRAEETMAGISTGEDRVDPDNPDDGIVREIADSEADAAQDALDEAHETAAAREAGGGAKTLDDVRAALGKYVKAFGMAAAQEDGPRVLSMVCGDDVVKISAVPDDKIAAVIAGIEEMTTKNPFKRAAA
jgi:hypothetical protein